eukprot:2305735-Pyramimonas_sp.AAC.1
MEKIPVCVHRCSGQQMLKSGILADFDMRVATRARFLDPLGRHQSSPAWPVRTACEAPLDTFWRPLRTVLPSPPAVAMVSGAFVGRSWGAGRPSWSLLESLMGCQRSILE